MSNAGKNVWATISANAAGVWPEANRAQAAGSGGRRPRSMARKVRHIEALDAEGPSDKTQTHYLRYTSVRVLPHEYCERVYPLEYHEALNYCAYQKGTDTCQGDSGGPLFAKSTSGTYVQVGVVSHGIGCAQEGAPGVYARVDAYAPWLTKAVASDEGYSDLSVAPLQESIPKPEDNMSPLFIPLSWPGHTEIAAIYVIHGHADIRQGARVRVEKVLRHAEYDDKLIFNDIAILLMEKPFRYGTEVKPICFPTKPLNAYNKNAVIAVGNTADHLQFTIVKIQPNDVCEKIYSDSYRKDKTYCAFRNDTGACFGDSGSPLFMQAGNVPYVQVGIVSHGFSCESAIVYAKVEGYIDWVVNATRSLKGYRNLSAQ
ncbi:polyserase-2-like [Rhipicephalus sanguineus]|uniref:polyserase-2-like n=1 Tax=Rhipicephalus sanguineus TaxID=34632 RepID=UPI001892F46A|nr:polyserase-2-like [Rhipicephalus sanguineus]